MIDKPPTMTTTMATNVTRPGRCGARRMNLLLGFSTLGMSWWWIGYSTRGLPTSFFACFGVEMSAVASRQDFTHHVAVHIGQPEVTAAEAVRQPFVIDAQEM